MSIRDSTSDPLHIQSSAPVSGLQSSALSSAQELLSNQEAHTSSSDILKTKNATLNVSFSMSKIAKTAAIVIYGSALVAESVKGFSGDYKNLEAVLKDIGSVSSLMKMGDKLRAFSLATAPKNEPTPQEVAMTPSTEKICSATASLLKISSVVSHCLAPVMGTVVITSKAFQYANLEALGADFGMVAAFITLGEKGSELARHIEPHKPLETVAKEPTVFSSPVKVLISELSDVLEGVSESSYILAMVEAGKVAGAIYAGSRDFGSIAVGVGAISNFMTIGEKSKNLSNVLVSSVDVPKTEKAKSGNFLEKAGALAANIGSKGAYLGGVIGIASVGYGIYVGDYTGAAVIAASTARMSAFFTVGDKLHAMSKVADKKDIVEPTEKIATVRSKMLQHVATAANVSSKIAYAAATVGVVAIAVDVGASLWSGDYTRAATIALTTATLPALATTTSLMMGEKLSQFASYLGYTRDL